MNISAAGVNAAYSQLNTSPSSAQTADAGGVALSVLKEAVNFEADMALKLISINLEASFAYDKMALTQQIVDMYV